MKAKDTIEKTLEAYNDVFADIANVLLFKGKPVIAEDSLSDAQPFSYYKAWGKRIRTQERDVAKYWQNGQIRIAFMGMENQTEPEREMPLRVIGYDGAAYRSQIPPKRKRKKLAGNEVAEIQESYYPIITMVLYFGTRQKWDKNLSLKEIISVPEGLEDFVSDYRINVCNLAWLSDDEINKFQSDFKEVVLYLKAKRESSEFEGTAKDLDHAPEILDLFYAMSGDDSYKLFEEELLSDDKEPRRTKMCEVTQRIKDAGRQEGRAEGRQEGENRILAFFSKLLAAGKTDEMNKAIQDREYLKKLMDEWQK